MFENDDLDDDEQTEDGFVVVVGAGHVVLAEDCGEAGHEVLGDGVDAEQHLQHVVEQHNNSLRVHAQALALALILPHNQPEHLINRLAIPHINRRIQIIHPQMHQNKLYLFGKL